MEHVWTTGKRVLVIFFLGLIRPKSSSRNSLLYDNQERQDQFQKRCGQGPLSQEMKSKIGAQFNADICEKAVDNEFIISGEYSAEFYGWTAKTANIGAAIRRVRHTFLISMLEDKIQKPSDYVRKLCYGSKKWRWLNQRMISNLHVLAEELMGQTLRYSM